MASRDTVIAAWVVVSVITVACLVASACVLHELWRVRRAGNYRVSTIIITRSAPDDIENPVSVQGGDVCFLSGDPDDLCFICCERPTVDATGVCGHGGMCSACFTRVWACPNAKCPVCRGLMRASPSSRPQLGA
jgi:hypothetical protein